MELSLSVTFTGRTFSFVPFKIGCFHTAYKQLNPGKNLNSKLI